MKRHAFRPAIDNVLRERLSGYLGLTSYSRGPDFKTMDRKYVIEMKCRMTKDPKKNDHFSIRPRQFINYKNAMKQVVLNPSKNSPIYEPNLLFLFLRYSTEQPVKKINDLWQEQIIIHPSYLVDYKVINPCYKPELKWMTVQTGLLNKKIDNENIEAVEIKTPELMIFPIGKNSKELVKRWL
ncbi:MAG: hypothetical protein V1818_00770 [Candidatus Aenigmatarchaeota archaeon]